MKQNSNKNSNFISSLHLSPKTTLGALGDKAKRATIIAEICKNKSTEKSISRKSKSKPQKPKLPIEMSIDTIKRILHDEYAEQMEITWEKPNKFSSAYACVKLYSKLKLALHKKLMEEWERQGKNSMPKPKAVTPDLAYTFYTSYHFPDQLESAAIYCAEASKLACDIKAKERFLNHPVARVSLEMGLRPFVDVHFKCKRVS